MSLLVTSLLSQSDRLTTIIPSVILLVENEENRKEVPKEQIGYCGKRM